MFWLWILTKLLSRWSRFNIIILSQTWKKCKKNHSVLLFIHFKYNHYYCQSVFTEQIFYIYPFIWRIDIVLELVLLIVSFHAQATNKCCARDQSLGTLTGARIRWIFPRNRSNMRWSSWQRQVPTHPCHKYTTLYKHKYSIIIYTYFQYLFWNYILYYVFLNEKKNT